MLPIQVCRAALRQSVSHSYFAPIAIPVGTTSASSSLTNSSAGTVATTGSSLGGRPSTRTAVPTRVKSMLSSTCSGIVRIFTSSTALAPAALASSRSRRSAVCQPWLCPSVQDQP